MEPLQAVEQHRPIDLRQDVLAEVDVQIRADPKDVPVERHVVNLAQDQPVGHDRSAAVGVAHDVRRVDAQAADGAAASVGTQDRLPEAGLMHPRLHDLSAVLPRDLVGRQVIEVASTELREVEAELMRRRIPSEDMDGPVPGRSRSGWSCG
jgi:hypothetical protein